MRNFLNKTPNIDFMKLKKFGYLTSIILVLLSVAIIYIKGFNLGLDFTGGTSIQIRFKKPVEIGQLREALKEVDLADSVIQEIGNVPYKDYRFNENHNVRINTINAKSDDVKIDLHEKSDDSKDDTALQDR